MNIWEELLPSVSIKSEIRSTKWPSSLRNVRTEGYIALHLEYIYNAKYAIREKFPNFHFLINPPPRMEIILLFSNSTS